MKLFLLTAFALVRLGFFGAAAVLFLRRLNYRRGEAVSFGVVLMFALLSLMYQVAFLARVSFLTFPAECLCGAGAVWYVVRHRDILADLGRAAAGLFGQWRFSSAALLAMLAYLLAQVLLLPQGNFDSMTYNLARVWLFQQENTLLLNDVSTVRQTILPVGHDILFHLFLRFRGDHGAGIFSFLSYLSIGAGTYSLSRRFARPAVAWTVLLVLLSFPELVYQATTTKNDLAVGAVAVACLGLLFRMGAAFRVRDFALFLLFAAFGVSVKTTWMLLMAPLAFFFASTLLRPASLRAAGESLRHSWKGWVPLILACLVLSQLWLFAANHRRWGNWLGEPSYCADNRQTDGLSGMAANLARYAFQSVDVLPPGDKIIARWTGKPLTGWLASAYARWGRPVFKDAATNSLYGPFYLVSCSHEDAAWFGPFLVLIAFPALLWSLFRFRSEPYCAQVAATALGFPLVLSYFMVWSPWNCRYLSSMAVMSGVGMAVFLRDLRIPRGALAALRAVAVLVLVYAGFANQMKPLFWESGRALPPEDWSVRRIVHGIGHEGIWAQTRMGADRFYFADRHFGGPWAAAAAKALPAGSTVGLMTGADTWVYPFFMACPSVRFIPVSGAETGTWPKGLDYLLALDVVPDPDVFKSAACLWRSPEGARTGALFKISR